MAEEHHALIEKAHEDGVRRFVVGSVIIDKCKVLIVRRKENDFLGGFYEVPGGAIERGETIEDALRREVLEETGLKVKSIRKYLGSFDYPSKSGDRTRQFSFIVQVSAPSPIRLQEHDEFAWVGVRELDGFNISGNIRDVIIAGLNGVLKRRN